MKTRGSRSKQNYWKRKNPKHFDEGNLVIIRLKKGYDLWRIPEINGKKAKVISNIYGNHQYYSVEVEGKQYVIDGECLSK
jgi:hypothetical protein